MRIGITGAFGFLGSNLVRHAIDNGEPGDHVVAFRSRTARNPLFDPAKVDVLDLDIRDPKDLAVKTRGLDVLFHLAGKVGYARMDARSIWDTNVLGARNVFEAVLDNRIARFVYISSINVLGAPLSGSAGALADESNSPYCPQARNPNRFRSPGEALDAVDASLRGDYRFLRGMKVAYFDSKLAAFELAKRYRGDRGMPLVTVFPGTVVGAGDVHREISELVDRVARSALAFTFTGGTSFVDVRDCARGIWLAMRNGGDGGSYILSGTVEENLHYKDFMRLAAETARKLGMLARNRFIAVPHIPALVVGSIAEAFYPRSPLNAGLVHSGKMTHRFSSARAEAEIGYTHEHSLAEGIESCLRFLRQFPA